jgi:hypothetical protein
MSSIAISSSSRLQIWFWFLLLINTAFIFTIKSFLQPLQTGEIIRFETTKTVSNAIAIIDNWVAEGKFDKAVLSIWLDYIFILLYVAGLMVSVVFISEATHHPLLVRSGRFFRWLIPAAGICDVLENIFMMQSLRGNVSTINVMLSYDMAVTKFSILIVSLLFIVLCLIFWFVRKLM